MQSTVSEKIERIHRVIQPQRDALLNHRIYEKIRGIEGLRTFMEHHVFAVWDFMSLLKALQQKFCCVTLPWIPSESPLACRLINEIVLGEESDEDGEDGFASHFKLYLGSMRECGADTTRIDSFINELCAGNTLREILASSKYGEPVGRFVSETFDIIDSGDSCAIASAFTFGREDLLPDLFRKIVEGIHGESEGKLDQFRYYLDRHIDLDDDKHGPMAEKLVEHLCGADSAKWKTVETTAVRALKSRLELWDSVADLLTEQ
jgi:hypothetical protein